MNITVIGCGRLGAPYAAGMASLGHHVLGLDTNPDTVAALQAGKAPFAEPGLAEAITEGAATGGLIFTDSYEHAARHATVHFLAVPTPQSAEGGHHDLRDVFTAAESLARVLDRDSLIVVKSSVPAGTCAAVAERMACLAGPGVRVEVAASPDFMRESCSIADVRRPSRIVLGVQPDGEAEKILRRLWAPCLDAGVPLVVTDLATAELCKLAANAFLATRISFVNALATFCDAAGADIDHLTRVIGHDPRIGADYLAPGLGFGGSCLSKDLRGFVALATDLGVGQWLNMLSVVDQINQGRRHRTVELTTQALGGDPAGRRVAVWGAAFKPGIDDIRDSPALDVAVRLHRAGARVTVYDPQAMPYARAEHPELEYATDPVSAVDGAEVLLHLTGWPQFTVVDPATLHPAPNAVLLDARGGLDHHRWAAAGWSTRSL
jgi:UDPglucose 6-dehydrogenase